jgi:hypothetical protein
MVIAVRGIAAGKLAEAATCPKPDDQRRRQESLDSICQADSLE